MFNPKKTSKITEGNISPIPRNYCGLRKNRKDNVFLECFLTLVLTVLI
jgi:hypothetical protein